MKDNSREFLIELGNRIKTLRQSRKLTLEAFCYLNGLEPSTVMRIEKALTTAKVTTLLKIAQGFDMSLPELLNIPLSSQ